MPQNQQTSQTTPDLDLIIKEGLTQFDMTDELSAAEPEDDSKEKGPAADQSAASADNAGASEIKRFTNHDEAEKGYKNLQAEYTRVTQHNKELTGKLTAQEQAEKQKQAEETVSAKFETFATERRTKLLDEIDALDPDAPDYRTQVAKAQARADKAILLAGRSFNTSAAQPATPVEAVAAANPDREAAAPDASVPDKEKVRNYVREKIAAPEIGGLDPDDTLFWMYASHAPVQDADGKNLSLDDQIQWAVEQTKTYHSKIIPRDPKQDIDTAVQNANANQRIDMPLGRASSGAPPADPGKSAPVSLSDAIDEANNRRRL